MGYFRGNGGKKTKIRGERLTCLKGGLGGKNGTLGTFFSYDPPLLLLSTSYQTRIAYVSLRIVPVLFPLLEARMIERRKKDERRMNEGWYENYTGLIRTRYVADTAWCCAMERVLLRFCFIALRLLKFGNCQLCAKIEQTERRTSSLLVRYAECSLSYAKIVQEEGECKSIYNHSQSFRIPFTIFHGPQRRAAVSPPFSNSIAPNKTIGVLTSSLRTPKFFVKEFSYFLMPCHQHGLRINLLV